MRSQTGEIPAGRIESTNREFSVLSKTKLSTPIEFNNLVLRFRPMLTTTGAMAKIKKSRLP